MPSGLRRNGTVNIDLLENGSSRTNDMACIVANKTKRIEGKDDSLIDQRRIFLNIHGHTHESSANVPLVTPRWSTLGFEEGKFVILDMVRKLQRREVEMVGRKD